MLNKEFPQIRNYLQIHQINFREFFNFYKSGVIPSTFQKIKDWMLAKKELFLYIFIFRPIWGKDRSLRALVTSALLSSSNPPKHSSALPAAECCPPVWKRRTGERIQRLRLFLVQGKNNATRCTFLFVVVSVGSFHNERIKRVFLYILGQKKSLLSGWRSWNQRRDRAITRIRFEKVLGEEGGLCWVQVCSDKLPFPLMCWGCQGLVPGRAVPLQSQFYWFSA